MTNNKFNKISLTVLVSALSISLISCVGGGSGSTADQSTANNSPVTNPDFIYSPYKDVETNMNRDTFLISTMVNEPVLTPFLQALPNNINTVTWFSASGECGNEQWGWRSKLFYSDFASVNVNAFVAANKKYIVSAGSNFTCSTQVGMKTFVDHYMSANLVGLDFYIDDTQTNSEISTLINNIAYIKTIYPNLRISFTLETEADSTGGHAGVRAAGDYAIKTAQNAKLDFYANLMTMDYSYKPSPRYCVINPATNQCDMAKSAIQAVQNLQYTYGIAANRIEVTPAIGEDDKPEEVFTLSDASTLAAYVKNNGLAGYHYFSYDRDTPCTATNKNPLKCNLAPNATPLGFNNVIAPYFQ